MLMDIDFYINKDGEIKKILVIFNNFFENYCILEQIYL